MRELEDRLPGMMTLIALAITVAFLFSVAVTLGLPGHAALGGARDARHHHAARPLDRDALDLAGAGRARRAREAPARHGVARAREGADERVEEVPVPRCARATWCSSGPGASIPADGVVREGTSAVNESMITGESAPVEKNPGDKVIAGTVNGAGSLRVEVTGTGEQTALAGIMRLVEQAQSLALPRAGAGRPRRVLAHHRRASAPAALTLVGWLVARAAVGVRRSSGSSRCS